MRFAPWPQYLRCVPLPHQRCQNPAEASSQGLLPVFGYKGRVRQRRQEHFSPDPKGRRNTPLSGLLGFVILRGTKLHPNLPRGPRDPGPHQRWRPSWLPDLPNPLCSLRGASALQDPLGSYDLVSGRGRPYSRLPLLPWQHRPDPGTLRQAWTKGVPPGGLLFSRKEGAVTLEDPQPEGLATVCLTHSD